MEQLEIWKDIPNYEGLYQASNLGNVQSFKNNKILKPYIIGGYHSLCLCKNGNKRLFYIHQLVAMSFLNHIPCGFNLVVNHKNFIKTDNRLENLEVITHRENTNLKHIKSTSEYVGVVFYKPTNKWLSKIQVKGKNIYLGYYNNEKDANQVYQKALNIIDIIHTINRNELNTILGTNIKKTYSKIKGVTYNIVSKRWTIYTDVDGKRKYLGGFKTEIEAIDKITEYNSNKNTK